MAWEIHGSARATSAGGYDGSVWEWQLIANDDQARQRLVIVRISGTVMAMGEETLSPRIAMARETQGGSEVEMILDWPEPPREIEVLSHGIRPAGGDPGPEQREITEIIDWFDDRSAMVIFGAHGVRLERHSAHVMDQATGDYLYTAPGLSRLEAVRRAKEQWDAEAREEKGEPSATQHTLSIDQAALETLRSQGKHLAWVEPVDPADPIWMAQVFDDQGVLLEIALGQSPEDLLLEVAEALLPRDEDTPS